jgi:hypothetical protein
MMDISKLCTPALIYFIISVISIIVALFNKFKAVTILIKVVFVLIWTWFLNYLCNKGLAVVSWVLVLLPFLIMFGMMALILETINPNVSSIYGSVPRATTM